uniref:Uncharacterized protein n=1 Tax=Lotus japonicus TaxID=34305 RepID=I3S1R8_LOTJA|nr:unknown [Lotus japonicus]
MTMTGDIKLKPTIFPFYQTSSNAVHDIRGSTNYEEQKGRNTMLLHPILHQQTRLGHRRGQNGPLLPNLLQSNP